MVNLDADFGPALQALAAEVGVPPDWFLVVFYLESRLDPAARNSLSYAGLNQIAASYLESRGIAPDDYQHWPASHQVADVIAPWFKRVIATFLGRPPTSPSVLYALNLFPASIRRGTTASTVMISATAKDAGERKAYVANQALDRNKDGVITLGDFDAFLWELSQQAPYKAALASLGLTSTLPPPGVTGVPGAGVVAGSLVIMLAALAWVAWSRR